ncbi:MAG: hypothetical protein ACTSP6_11270 [Promethearchaeota archaeon]
MSENNYISFRDLISESLIRDVILFLFLFLLVLAQDWDNIFLLLFPLIMFSFAVFFKILYTIKNSAKLDNSHIIYNPLGSEKVYSHRLNFCALLQLLLLFWFGAESLYHPQLIENYLIYFISIYIFLYTFGFYWIFFDLWEYSKIEILTEEISGSNFQNVVSFLNYKIFKAISIISFLVFIFLNLLNILFAYLTVNEMMLGIQYNLPGTGIEKSEPINLPYTTIGIIFIPPIISAIFLHIIYNNITNINSEKLEKVLDSLPGNVKIEIIENLRVLNKKFQNKAKLE